MANPKNTGTYTGRVTRLHFIYDKSNEPFQLRFVIKVERGEITKSGKKLYDFLPMRISGAKRMHIARRLKEGDYISITGAMRSELYEVNGKPYYGVYVNVEDLAWITNGRPNYSLDGDGIPAPPIEELPFG